MSDPILLGRRTDEQRSEDDRDEQDFITGEPHFTALFT